MTKDLQDELMKIGQAAYANTGGSEAAGGAPPPSGAEGEKKKQPEDFIDVEAQ